MIPERQTGETSIHAVALAPCNLVFPRLPAGIFTPPSCDKTQFAVEM